MNPGEAVASAVSHHRYSEFRKKVRRCSPVSPKNKPDHSRRSFLAGAAVAASAALVGLKPPAARAAGDSLPHLSESDPLAKSLGYQ